jgi:hypothetical protein
MKHLCLLFVLGLTACDGRATASGAGEAVMPKRLSAELESCGATAHCAEGLRCWDRVCMREGRSTLGDFHAARGQRAAASGDSDAAVAAYALSLAAYDTDKLAAPPDIECAYGATLARVRGTKEDAERAAAALHKCLLAVPVAVGLRAQAMAGLAELESAGLDPALVALKEPARLYLTRAPSAPATDKLTVSVSADPVPRGKSYSLITERLAQPDARAALIPCWEKNFAASQSKTLDAKLGLEVKYRPSEYDDEPGIYAVAWSNPPAAGAAADAQACVRAAIEPLIAPLKLRDAFQATLTVSIR